MESRETLSLHTTHRLTGFRAVPQIQAELGEGHVNVVTSKEVLLTADHLALVMEYAAGGNLTSYVTSKWPRGQTATKALFLSEDEARYYFRVSAWRRVTSGCVVTGPSRSFGSMPAARVVLWAADRERMLYRYVLPEPLSVSFTSAQFFESDMVGAGHC